MPFDDNDWQMLLERIRDGKCTPFLGAGVNQGVLPTGTQIARKWSEEYKYPLEDGSDLARVAQFIGVSLDKMYPKEKILRSFTGIAPPNFDAAESILGTLADLPLPVYITTNYDDFARKALLAKHKDPKRELCRWNSQLRKYASIFDNAAGYEPTPASPVVFHLHGHDEVPESIVLTEDDYLEFLVQISKETDLLPPRIQRALTGSSLIFVGYRLADWDFRVIFRGLVTSMESSLRRISLTVQLPPLGDDPKGQSAQKYLGEYFGDVSIRVYWGTAEKFAAELRERWQKFQH